VVGLKSIKILAWAAKALDQIELKKNWKVFGIYLNRLRRCFLSNWAKMQNAPV
jgi:hypothetical protein